MDLELEPTSYHHQQTGLKFRFPVGWEVEELEDGSILLICSEIEHNWQATMNLGFQSYPEGMGLREILRGMIGGLNTVKEGFQLLRSGPMANAAGMEAGEVVYRNTVAGIALVTHETLVRTSPTEFMFFSSCCVSDLEGKYTPSFETVLGSVEVVE